MYLNINCTLCISLKWAFWAAKRFCWFEYVQRYTGRCLSWNFRLPHSHFFHVHTDVAASANVRALEINRENNPSWKLHPQIETRSLVWSAFNSVDQVDGIIRSKYTSIVSAVSVSYHIRNSLFLQWTTVTAPTRDLAVIPVTRRLQILAQYIFSRSWMSKKTHWNTQ